MRTFEETAQRRGVSNADANGGVHAHSLTQTAAFVRIRREACAFGVGQQCVLPSKTLFFRLKETFEKDLRLDGKTGLSEPPSSLASPLP